MAYLRCLNYDGIYHFRLKKELDTLQAQWTVRERADHGAAGGFPGWFLTCVWTLVLIASRLKQAHRPPGEPVLVWTRAILATELALCSYQLPLSLHPFGSKSEPGSQVPMPRHGVAGGHRPGHGQREIQLPFRGHLGATVDNTGNS